MEDYCFQDVVVTTQTMASLSESISRNRSLFRDKLKHALNATKPLLNELKAVLKSAELENLG